MNVNLFHGRKLDKPTYKTGSWEYGPGLYLVDDADIARRYAKGGRKLYEIKVMLNPEDSIEGKYFDYTDLCLFPSAKNRIENYIDDRGISIKEIPMSVFLNICIETLPSTKARVLRNYLVEHGVKYLVTTYEGANMLVLFDDNLVYGIKHVTGENLVSNFSEFLPSIEMKR